MGTQLSYYEGKQKPTVELEYNPYILETNIRFNGRPPYINSAVEKYKNSRLDSWIGKLPHIFNEEMNGFGFEIEFSGTDLDFEELKNSFVESGLSSNSVSCIHKVELEDRETKVTEIKNLLLWLASNENRTFDYNEFKNNNPDVFIDRFQLILFHGNGFDENIEHKWNVSLESIDSSVELKNFNLTDVPIIYLIDRKSVAVIQEDISYLLGRHDFKQRQIFFMISNGISRTRAERIIRDIGIVHPVVLEKSEDDNLMRYCLLYPITDQINDAVKLLSEAVATLDNEAEKKKIENDRQNHEIYQRIDSLDNTLSDLKRVQGKIQKDDELEIPLFWKKIVENLEQEINGWRNNKIKTINTAEAEQYAWDLDSKVHIWYGEFIDNLENAALMFKNSYETEFEDIYRNGGEGADFKNFIPEKQEINFNGENDIPSISGELLKLKNEEYVAPKPDIFGMLFMPQDDASNTPVLEVSYIYEEWRDYALKTVRPRALKLISSWHHMLASDYDKLKEKYLSHISELIEKTESEKEQVSSQLSEDDKKFQDDMNWLSEFKNQMEKIKRG